MEEQESHSPVASAATENNSNREIPMTAIGRPTAPLIRSHAPENDSKGQLINPTGKTSEWWQYFKTYSNAKHIANCRECGADVVIGEARSTSKLTQHMTNHHRGIVLESAVKEKRDLLSMGSAESDAGPRKMAGTITSHFKAQARASDRRVFLF
jgi:hypothetical protein